MDCEDVHSILSMNEWLKENTNDMMVKMKPKIYVYGWDVKAYENYSEMQSVLDMYPFNELKARYDTSSKTITRIENKKSIGVKRDRKSE